MQKFWSNNYKMKVASNDQTNITKKKENSYFFYLFSKSKKKKNVK